MLNANSSTDAMYRLLVQGVTDYAIYMLSPEGTVSNWNAGAEKFQGYTAEEIVGQHFSVFYPHEDRSRRVPHEALETARSTGRFEGEGWRLRKDGTRFWAHVILDRIEDQPGNLVGFAEITRDMTNQHTQAQKACEQERNFRLLVQGVTDYAIYTLSPAGHVTNWNVGAERVEGYEASEILGKHFSHFYSQEDRRKGLPQRALALARSTGKFEGEGWRIRKNGTQFWAYVVIDPIYDDLHELVGYAKITRDLTSSKRQIDEIQMMKENLNLALSNMSQGLCLFDEREQLLVCNPRFQEILGLEAGAIKPGSTFVDLLWEQYADSGTEPETIAIKIEESRKQHLQALQEWGTITQEQEWRGRIIAVEHRRLHSGGWVSTMEDVTEKKNIETRIRHMAHHDFLTELPNRASLRGEIERHLRNQVPCAILYMDLDRFKPINDTLGHSAGDEVLKEVAERISSQLRKHDFGARLGGDEFALLLAGCHNIADAGGVADRLIREISRPIQVNGVEITVGLSIGIAFSPRHGVEADILLRNADLALYSAKQAGRGCHREYEDGMEKQLEERLQLERDLREALLHNQFSLHYQPVVDVDRNIVTSFEALLRWSSPTRGNVAPVHFIPFAEEIGMMCEIGEWVLRTACREAATWPDETCIAVNLSPSQFNMPELVESVSRALTESGLPARRLELEITETAMIRDLDSARALLNRLRDLGVQIALDDFGTGYSSLSFLRNLPFTRIKIDRSFIQDLGQNSEALAIIRAVTSLCEGLKVSATAEGVETQEQIDILKKEGCVELQGYFIKRPSLAEEARQWHTSYQATHSEPASLLLLSA